jgi:hypothetical protein
MAVRFDVRRRGIRTLLLLIIAATVPCYCTGGALLLINPLLRPPQTTPTVVVTSTGEAVGLAPTRTLVPSITPFLGIPTTIPNELLPTPPQVELLESPTPLTIFPTPGGWNVGGNPTAQGQIPFCADFSGITNEAIRAYIPGGTAGGASIYCRSITDTNQIGVQSVISRGVLVAVDIFALTGSTYVTRFNNSIEVCLRGSGTFIFLDANQSPRSPAELSSVQSNGYTCASVPNAGTAVLVSQ